MDERPKAMKILEENIGISFHNLGLDNSFLDDSKSKSGQKDKMDSIKMKNLWTAKHTVKQVKRQPP